MNSFGQFRFPRYRPELDQSARSVSRSPNRENSKSCRLVSFDFRDTDLSSIIARGPFRYHLIERTAKVVVWSVSISEIPTCARSKREERFAITSRLRGLKDRRLAILYHPPVLVNSISPMIRL